MGNEITDEELTKIAEKFGRNMSALAMYNNICWWATGSHRFQEETLNKALGVLDEVILHDFKDQFLMTFSKDAKFYRARTIRPEDYGKCDLGLVYIDGVLHGYNADQSKEPPAYLAAAGRLSKEGEVALYLADDITTACSEIKPPMRGLISIATFNLANDIEVIDFSKLNYDRPLNVNDLKYDTDTREFLSKIFALFTKPILNTGEYVITQKLASHFREKGYNGFSYRSFYTDKRNFTFFDDAMGLFEWLDSKVVINYSTANLYVSMDIDPELKSFGNINKVTQDIEEANRSSLLGECKKLFYQKPMRKEEK